MRTSSAVLAFVMVGAISGVAHAQDAPPPQQPPPGGPPPGAMPPPPPPPGYGPPPTGEQERTANNAIYVDLLGPGLLYSIDYDRAFGDFAVRVGFSYFSLGVSATAGNSGVSESASFMTFPITVSYIGIGSKKHIFELGAGATIISLGVGASVFGAEAKADATGNAIIVAPTAVLGYRLQPPDGGFFFHAGLAPQVFIGGQDVAVWPAPYVGLGGTF